MVDLYKKAGLVRVRLSYRYRCVILYFSKATVLLMRSIASRILSSLVA